MLNLDLWANTFRQFKVAKAYDVGDCRCCKHRTFEFLDGKFGSSTTTLCGRNAVQITNKPGSGPSAAGKLDFAEIGKRLEAHGTVKANKFMLRADITDNGEPYELTLFTDGRAIVKGTKHANVGKRCLREIRRRLTRRRLKRSPLDPARKPLQTDSQTPSHERVRQPMALEESVKIYKFPAELRRDAAEGPERRTRHSS